MVTILEGVRKDFKDSQSLTEKLEQLKDVRAPVYDGALKSLRPVAYDFGVQYGGIDSKETKADDLKEEDIKKYGSAKVSQLHSDSANVFNNNVDAVVDSVEEGRLEKLTKTEIIQKTADGKNRESLQKYSSYLGISELVSKYEKGERLSEEETGLVGGFEKNGANLAMKAVFDEAQKIESERQKKKEYSDKRLEAMAGALAVEAVKAGYRELNVKEYVIKELKSQVGKAKESYDKVGIDYKDAVRGIIKKLAKGDSKQFETALGLVCADLD
jgi:hypothetical protein